MRRYFKRTSGKPVFKKGVTSFTIDLPNPFRIVGDRLFIQKLNFMPKTANGIKLGEKLRLNGCPKQITISTESGKWYVSISGYRTYYHTIP